MAGGEEAGTWHLLSGTERQVLASTSFPHLFQDGLPFSANPPPPNTFMDALTTKSPANLTINIKHHSLASN